MNKNIKQHIQQVKRKIWANRELLGIGEEEFKSWPDRVFSQIDIGDLQEFITESSRPKLFYDPTKKSRYTIIYRFAEMEEFTLEPDIESEFPCYNYQSPDRSTIYHLDVLKNSFSDTETTTMVAPAIYNIKSSNAIRLISAEEYLRTTYGVGGQYVGFNEYLDETQNLYNWAHLSQTFDIYGGSRGRICIISFLEAIINPAMAPTTATLLNPDGYEPPIVADYCVSLDSVIPVTRGVLWYGRLGALMPPESANSAEHNFVGDVNIPAIAVLSHNLSCIKTILSAAYHGYFDNFIY